MTASDSMCVLGVTFRRAEGAWRSTDGVMVLIEEHDIAWRARVYVGASEYHAARDCTPSAALWRAVTVARRALRRVAEDAMRRLTALDAIQDGAG